jgi:Flp pilus assembly CpaE family ATPase
VALRIAVNRFESGWRRPVGLKEAERALGRPIDDRIANDYRTVSEAIDRGVALADIRRRSKAAKDIQRMIDAAQRAVAEDKHDVALIMPRLLAAHRA